MWAGAVVMENVKPFYLITKYMLQIEWYVCICDVPPPPLAQLISQQKTRPVVTKRHSLPPNGINKNIFISAWTTKLNVIKIKWIIIILPIYEYNKSARTAVLRCVALRCVALPSVVLGCVAFLGLCSPAWPSSGWLSSVLQSDVSGFIYLKRSAGVTLHRNTYMIRLHWFIFIWIEIPFN